MNTANITLKGTWTAFISDDRKPGETQVVIESSDFTHDVWLHVSGDFINQDEKLKYAKAVAAKLNTPDVEQS
jgi:hypothetical protein